jgi:microcystin degradation protein MlrC
MTRPRVAAAQLSHETNVFSAVPTDLAAFEASGMRFGTDILASDRGTNSAFGGFIPGAERNGFELLPIISVWATPSGMVTKESIGFTLDALIAGLQSAIEDGPLAGVLLALHGAMVTEVDEDGDAYILERVRDTVGQGVPIVSTLDLHANISQRMVDAADLLIGYDTYPHVDIAERAGEVCDQLARLIRGEIRPTPCLIKPPMLPTSQNMPTNREPMRSLIAQAHEYECDPHVLNVTVAGGFPPSDGADAGFSVLVTTNDDPAPAKRLATDLAKLAWETREGFLGGVTSFEEAAQAIRDADPIGKPIVLVDIGDNPWTGGPGDSAELVRFLIQEGVSGTAVALVCDPETVQQAINAGIGAEIDVNLGGKTDRLHGDPLHVLAKVKVISDGRFVNDGPMMAGVPVDLGPTVVLTCAPDSPSGGVDVLVCSRAETIIDLNAFRSHGIEPTTLRVIGLKGKGHFRAAFEPIASQVILVEGPGITGSDLSRLPFKSIRRPIWPIDPETTYQPA